MLFSKPIIEKSKTSSRKSRRLATRPMPLAVKLFAQIDRELTNHSQAEEAIFSPAYKAKTKRDSEESDEVLEAFLRVLFAGIIHQDVKAPELLNGSLHHMPAKRFLTNIARPSDDFAALGFD